MRFESQLTYLGHWYGDCFEHPPSHSTSGWLRYIHLGCSDYTYFLFAFWFHEGSARLRTLCGSASFGRCCLLLL
jgi:hypothetical protein